MLVSILRVMTAVSVVIVAALAYIQLSFVEQDFPLGSQHSGTIMFSESELTKEQVVTGLQELGRTHNIEIYLGAPDSDDPFHGLNLYALGANQPEQPSDIAWLNFTRHGKLYPASELGDVNLSAVYAVRGAAAGVAALEAWANESGASTSGWGDVTPLALFSAGLVYGAAGIPLVA